MQYTIEDYHNLMNKVLLQAMHDYIKLAHPSSRKKKHLREAFLDSASMFFDPEYRMKYFFNDEGQHMTLEDFLKIATDRERVDIEKLHQYLISETLKYWAEIPLMKIPEVILIAGKPWTVLHRDEGYRIEFEEDTIYINKKVEDAAQQLFLGCVDISCDALGIKMPAATRKEFSKFFSELLRMNNCFK